MVYRSKDGTNRPSPVTILTLPFGNRKKILANRNEALSNSNWKLKLNLKLKLSVEIEQALEVVRGGQLQWFLAWLLYVYRLLTCPKLGGERHLEAEEIRWSPGGFRSRRPEVARLVFFLCLWRDISAKWRINRSQNPAKSLETTQKNEGKWTVFIWLSLRGFRGWNVTICGTYDHRLSACATASTYGRLHQAAEQSVKRIYENMN